MNFTKFVRDYLALHGEALPALSAQMKQLDQKDRDDLVEYAAKQGIEVERSVVPA